ncbi:MAG: Ig-like domain-containing protein [Tannerella sp.]|jgi:uncharacterized protein YjdB|nr:Ig-like domain-containing protein [Tannerella sp.]
MNKYLYFYIVVFAYLFSSCAHDIAMQGDPIYIDSISVRNKISDISSGKEMLFIPTYYPSEADAPESYSWLSSNNSIATINRDGLLTAINEGKVTITLSAVVPRKKGTVELFNTMEISVLPIAIEGILLNTSNLQMVSESNFTLTVSFIPANAKPGEIEWSSDNEWVATVSGNGVVSAKSVGNAVITARLKANPAIEAKCSVMVNPIGLTDFRFVPNLVDSLEIGFTKTTQLVILPENADQRFSYVLSDYTTASVDVNNFNGLFTIRGSSIDPSLWGTGPKSMTITATSADGTRQAVCTVKVYSVPDLAKVTVKMEDKDRKTFITPTFHNNGSASILIKRFRLMNRSDIYESIILNEIVEPHKGYTLNQSIEFKDIQYSDFRAEFTIEFQGKEYRIASPYPDWGK